MSNLIISNSSANNIATLSDTEKKAGKKILKWYKKCSADREKELADRSQIIQQNVAQNTTVFTVDRVITKSDRKKLASEARKIANFYDTSAGQQLLQDHPLAKDNQDVWINTVNNLDYNDSYLPIVVRNNTKEIQSVALVNMNKHFRLQELATAPQNLGKKSGAGSAAFEDAVWLCKRRGFDSLNLVTKDSARIFYQKLGVHCPLWSGSLKAEQFPDFFRDHGGKAKPAGLRVSIDPDETDEKSSY